VSSVQRLLSEYLQCELYHSLGAYGVAERRLKELVRELKDPSIESFTKELIEVVELSRDYNGMLRQGRHASRPGPRPHWDGEEAGRRWPARDPLPQGLPLTKHERFEVGTSDNEKLRLRPDPWQHDSTWEVVPQFYTEAIEALTEHWPGSGTSEDRYVEFGTILAKSLVTPRDGGTGWDADGTGRHRRRLHRYANRRKEAHTALTPTEREPAGVGGRLRDRLRGWGEPQADPAAEIDTAYSPDRRLLERIATEHLSASDDSLGLFVIKTQAEAHLSMHAVEAWKSMCLGEHAESLGGDQREWLERELERSIALSTFACCVSRTAPWLFAKDENERDAIRSDVGEAWENVKPPRCIWIANQVGLLALHRRAYARYLLDKPEESYNDYHKLQQRIREAERRIREAPIHAEGAHEFLAGLNAEAHHHIGELYRAEHAHRPALDHFEAASHGLNQLREAEAMPEVLIDSRWNVELHISHGKACYEMGRHKEALYWYLQAWAAFLELFATASQTETNTEAIAEAVTWLDSVKFEPELRKSELSERLRPVVDQLDRITAVGQLGVLAAETLLRLGHLLLVLNIDSVEVGAASGNGDDHPGDVNERIRRTLAFSCLAKAAECDPHSTLAGADLLKAAFRVAGDTTHPRELLAERLAGLDTGQIKPVGEHWPHGGDDYEQLTRVAEYILLKAHSERVGSDASDSNDDASARLARDLLLNLFMSTDSINVRKAQIHRFLMRRPNDAAIPEAAGAAIEFVCMRRYSSPFPLLPRPSAFRALGGGYFLRLHGADDESRQGRPFGVVIDPGVDFVENLYRTEFSLSDIDMIVLTHDHVDHLGGLDPLLSLLHVRSELLSEQAKRGDGDAAAHEEEASKRKVRVLSNRSVAWRYGVVERLRNSEEIDFECFEDSELRVEDGVLNMGHPFFAEFPREFEIVVTSSAAGQSGNSGHLDLSMQPSHGVCVRARGGKKGPSLAITSDTPAPPDDGSEGHAKWKDAWAAALNADVLIVHLSSVPLTELRRMDQISQIAGPPEAREDPPPGSLEEDERRLEELREMLEQANKPLRGQIEYAQWLRSHVPGGGNLTAPLVGAVQPEWLPPTDHNYLTGLLSWAGAYRAAREAPHDPGGNGATSARGGLLVVGELSEELASMRGKIASRLNEVVFEASDMRRGDQTSGPSVLTADIGLRVCVTSIEGKDWSPPGTRVKILCTTCDLDTDLSPSERYHSAGAIHEVCVKGENEGIFYNCSEHDPKAQDDPTFLEQLERFDIFGR